MAEIATIARPYAEAAVQGWRARTTRCGLAEQLDALAAVAGNAAAAPVRRQPASCRSRRRSFDAGHRRSPRRRCRRRRRTCCARVIDNGRLAALPEIAAQFHALVNARIGRVGRRRSTAPSRSTTRSWPTWWPTLETRFGRKLNATRGGRSRADRRHPRGGRRRGARHLGQGPSRTNEGGADRLSALQLRA